MPYRLMEPRFPLGEVYASATSAARLAEDALLQLLHRHHCGDWGDLGDGDKQANEEALQTGERILSRYDLECGSFYMVTEADRSTTTVMGVEEYWVSIVFSHGNNRDFLPRQNKPMPRS